MIQITKIENGLRWNDEDRFFTKDLYENGYLIIDPIQISIELNQNIICLRSDETTIDGIGPFYTSQELLDAIYQNKL